MYLSLFSSEKSVWSFWHKMSMESSNTNQVAKFRVTDTSPVEAGLDFASSVTKEIETTRTKCTYFQCMFAM